MLGTLSIRERQTAKCDNGAVPKMGKSYLLTLKNWQAFFIIHKLSRNSLN